MVFKVKYSGYSYEGDQKYWLKNTVFLQKSDFQTKNWIFPKNRLVGENTGYESLKMSAKMGIVMCECKLHSSANKKHIYILSYILANILDSQLWNSDAGGCTPKKNF